MRSASSGFQKKATGDVYSSSPENLAQQAHITISSYTLDILFFLNFKER